MIQALVSLFRRAARAEPGQAEGIALLASGKWTLELLKHLEWRRLEELCAAYFAQAGFRTEMVHERADGSAQICLYAAGAKFMRRISPSYRGSALTFRHRKRPACSRNGISGERTT